MGKTQLASYARVLQLTGVLENFKINFDDRLEFQKSIYLLQEAGAPLGYQFGWYIYGPYSSSLANDAFPVASLPAESFKMFNEPINAEAIKRFQTLIKAIPRDRKRAYWLELLASVDYVMKHSYPKAKTKQEAIAAIMKLKRGKFGERDIERAFVLLQKNNFIVV